MGDIPGITIEDGVVSLEVDTEIYQMDAVLTSAYHYIDEYFVYLNQKGKGGLAVELTPKKKMSAAALKKMSGGFYNILLAETLRLKIHKQNRRFREEMLEKAIASALSSPRPVSAVQQSASPSDNSGRQTLELDEELKKIIEKVKTMDYRDDPLGIAVPINDSPPVKKAGGTRRKKKA